MSMWASLLVGTEPSLVVTAGALLVGALAAAALDAAGGSGGLLGDVMGGG